MRVLICGSRTWNDALPIKQRLIKLKEEHGMGLLIITGGAQGADVIASDLAKELGIDRVIFPANWKGRNRAAGFARNTLMLRMGKPDLVIGYHPFISNSKGTKMMLELAKADGVLTELHGAMVRDYA